MFGTQARWHDIQGGFVLDEGQTISDQTSSRSGRRLATSMGADPGDRAALWSKAARILYRFKRARKRSASLGSRGAWQAVWHTDM